MSKYAGIAGIKHRIRVPGNRGPAFVQVAGERRRFNAGEVVEFELQFGDHARLYAAIPGVQVEPILPPVRVQAPAPVVAPVEPPAAEDVGQAEVAETKKPKGK